MATFTTCGLFVSPLGSFMNVIVPSDGSVAQMSTPVWKICATKNGMGFRVEILSTPASCARIPILSEALVATAWVNGWAPSLGRRQSISQECALNLLKLRR